MRMIIFALLLAISYAQTESEESVGCTEEDEEFTIYYIRHGESIANNECKGDKKKGACKACGIKFLTKECRDNAEDCFKKNEEDVTSPITYRDIFDAKLNEKGKDDATVLQPKFKDVIGEGDQAKDFLFVASPLRRAFGTLALALEGVETQGTNTILIHPGLREMGTWCDIESEAFRKTGKDSKVPSENGIKHAEKYLTDLGCKKEKLDWNAFFSPDVDPYTTWIGPKEAWDKDVQLISSDKISMLRSVLKDILSKAKEEEKTKVIIGAHSNIWQFGISKLGNMGEIVCGDTEKWKQFESNKVANGAVIKFKMRLVSTGEGDNAVDMIRIGSNPSFQFKSLCKFFKDKEILKCPEHEEHIGERQVATALRLYGLTYTLPCIIIVFPFIIAVYFASISKDLSSYTSLQDSVEEL